LKFKFFLALSCLLANVLLIQSCKTAKEVEDLTQEDIKIKMNKGMCFGKCPVYNIEVYEGGYVKYYGKKFAPKLGVYDKQLSKDEYKILIKAFESSEFMTYKDEYESQVPDAPTVSLFFRNKNGESKNIIGKLNRPEEVKDLQVLVENIASTDGWNLLEKHKEEVVKKERKESEKPNVIKSEIIIEPNTDVNLTKWFAEKKKTYGVRIINKISPNLNLWLITYDQKMVDGDMLLQILQDDPDILTAEFNKKTTQRGGR